MRDWRDGQSLQPYAGKARQQPWRVRTCIPPARHGDRLQSLPALPPRRATSCRALVGACTRSPSSRGRTARSATQSASAGHGDAHPRRRASPPPARPPPTGQAPKCPQHSPLNITEPGRAALPRNIRVNPARLPAARLHQLICALTWPNSGYRWPVPKLCTGW